MWHNTLQINLTPKPKMYPSLIFSFNCRLQDAKQIPAQEPPGHRPYQRRAGIQIQSRAEDQHTEGSSAVWCQTHDSTGRPRLISCVNL